MSHVLSFDGLNLAVERILGSWCTLKARMEAVSQMTVAVLAGMTTTKRRKALGKARLEGAGDWHSASLMIGPVRAH